MLSRARGDVTAAGWGGVGSWFLNKGHRCKLISPMTSLNLGVATFRSLPPVPARQGAPGGETESGPPRSRKESAERTPSCGQEPVYPAGAGRAPGRGGRVWVRVHARQVRPRPTPILLARSGHVTTPTANHAGEAAQTLKLCNQRC